MRVVNLNSAFIDYRLRRRSLGLRVRRKSCQIIVALGSEWAGVGPEVELPLEVPTSLQDFPVFGDVSNALRVMAFRYELLRPGTDLIAVLSRIKPFENALREARPKRLPSLSEGPE
jgi:hypothetical protein